MSLAREVAVFLPVGGAAVAIDATVYAALLGIGAPTTLAKAAGFCAGALWAYHANKRLTFRAESGRLLHFAAVYLASLLLNLALNGAVLVLGGLLGLPDRLALPAAFVVATGVSAAANFVGMRIIVFRRS